MTAIHHFGNPEHRGGGRGALVLVISIVVVLVSLGSVGLYLQNLRAPTATLWGQITVGDAEARVRQVLGDPYKDLPGASAPSDYYIRGYGKRERMITGKVLIYRSADMILYVWIDTGGQVEEIFSGVS